MLDVPVYGGDCVVSSSGEIRIIDFNDWPSFARCREEAGKKSQNVFITGLQILERNNMSTEKKGIEASFKSMDTEEFLDIYFNRPVGYAWALFFKKLGVHRMS